MGRCRAFALPLTGTLQRIGDFGRHVIFIMLGKHIGRGEIAVLAKRSLGDDALPLAEEIGQHAAIGDGYGLHEIGDIETQRRISEIFQRALFDKAAKPDSLAGFDTALHDIARAVEEDDVVAHRKEHEAHGR